MLCLTSWVVSQSTKKDTRALTAFQNALQRDGFEVNMGRPLEINLVQAWCNDAIPDWVPFDHALYSNSQPYLAPAVPKSAAEPGTMSPLFRLSRDEAIVFIGRTPPPERYFGFYPFIRSRVNSDGIRQSLWASLGDPVNNLSVKTTGSSPFNSPVALIFTSDQGIDARVRKALERAGYPSAIINTVVFPAPMLNLGHGDAADEFIIALRNSMWQNRADGEAYIHDPPLTIFRVTPQAETTANPFPVPRLRVRGTGHSEFQMMDKLKLLRQRIIDQNQNLQATDIPTQDTAYEGYDYLQRGADPWGDARDAMYLTSGWVPEFGANVDIKLADGEFLMVYGVNHFATGKASYHSFNVYSSIEGKVPIGSVEDPAFPGTASPYLYDDPAAANMMYAFKVSRNCGQEPNCVQLALPNCSRLTIGPNTTLGIFFRMYLEPETMVGPAMPEILYDRVIKFSPRH